MLNINEFILKTLNYYSKGSKGLWINCKTLWFQFICLGVGQQCLKQADPSLFEHVLLLAQLQLQLEPAWTS